MKIGIIDTGNIARILAMTIKEVKTLGLYAISSRNMYRAKAFARYFNIPKAYGSYEAMWTRYMPSRHIINNIISSGIIGKISMVTVNLSYDVDEVERIQ